eukprot:481814_1
MFEEFLFIISQLILWLKIYGSSNCVGISLKSQLLYCFAFTCRYLNIFWDFSIIKITLLCVLYAIIWNIKFKYPILRTYDSRSDHFQIWILIIPSFILALFTMYFNSTSFSMLSLLALFSIYLETVSILPQLVMI